LLFLSPPDFSELLVSLISNAANIREFQCNMNFGEITIIDIFETTVFSNRITAGAV